MSDVMLEISDLAVSARSRDGDVEIVHGIDLSVRRGETVAVVGESGSGKSVSMLAVMRLLTGSLAISRGSVVFDGVDLTALDDDHIRAMRGRELAMVYQDPMTSLNPLMRVGDQVAEAMRSHGMSKTAARERTHELLAEVGIADPARSAKAYPHEFSGGMRQRVIIAMALALRPRLLIADEPTTALDVTIQQQILALVTGLQRDLGMTTIWVTHDLGVVARLVDRVVVMYAGHIVEDAPTRQLFAKPQHPYTHALLASLPNPADDSRPPLRQLTGRPPLPSERVEGCPFRPRCAQARDACAVRPVLEPRGEGAAACWVPAGEWRH
jgi:oligopeptide/dipeptide ABC transporter ATP-binding protein